ncbi:M56 family metallopeptidase [Edaphosphingomonas haloaromaticamans]|uniref:Methicillin resistance mecR1 protein n=1 Tax=Edaphosphingomonas haloaromaticamans TaxID=653954 RepID=A0A1S1HDH9_9SPHN|nr:M56 family metallopeptidase [Sphingomonas haloaromaticamans]OHT18540.1 Methicillin resistance mecR1 protein [Sphingomonas haloaromaticamans]
MSAALLLQNLAASALLMLLVLLVRGRIAALFGARLAYALWALPMIRLVMPPLPEIARPVAAHVPIRIDLSGLEGIAAALPAGAEAASPAMIAPHAAGMAAATGPDWAALMVPGLILLWLGGAALHFAWHIGLYRHFLKMALRGSAFLCRRCGIAVHVSAGVDGPVAAGIVRRRILLPGDFTRRYTRQEQRLVLAHEVAHHVRGDLIANIFALAMLSLHWFNPLAHIAYRAFRADQELACDETVLADEPATERHAYATALVKSATRGTPAAACALGAARIKRRLQMMATGKIGRARRLGGDGDRYAPAGGCRSPRAAGAGGTGCARRPCPTRHPGGAAAAVRGGAGCARAAGPGGGPRRAPPPGRSPGGPRTGGACP